MVSDGRPTDRNQRNQTELPYSHSNHLSMAKLALICGPFEQLQRLLAPYKIPEGGVAAVPKQKRRTTLSSLSNSKTMGTALATSM